MIQVSKKMTYALAAIVFMAAALLLSISSLVPYNTYVSTSNDEAAKAGIAVPIIMYHSVVKAGEATLGDYVTTTEALSKDIAYIIGNGYTPVFFSDLEKYANDLDYSLPAKPIIICFDDGYYNTYTYVYSIFKDQGIKFVVAVVGSYVEKAQERQSTVYSYCTWEQIAEMHESGIVELLNHSDNMHRIGTRRGILPRQGESVLAYEEALRQDLMKNQSCLEELGATSMTFVYPYGLYNKTTEAAIKKLGFTSSTTCEEGINYILKGAELFKLKRFNRPHGPSAETFFSNIII
ncbi:MAG: polysaccharide deacetylase family protein [Eubacteriaceae bacterium]|nr:polysaccharide deacetylase family protein [Eubacteriaceae bacterium]